jgi:FAD/FMN-containing dehydrogenase
VRLYEREQIFRRVDVSDQSGLTGTGDILARLWSIVGAANVFSGEAIEERYRTDVLRKHSSRPSYVVRPADTQQVSAVVKIAHDNDLAITALGGRTGVVGGGVSRDGGMILSLERMSRVLEVDCASMTMTVEAGVPLQIAQEAAAAHGFILPLDLGARGSATIGGNIATNAGGVRVLRWGMARDMVLGLEAVLADGTVVSSLSKSLKDNAGYHWKELLVGSEGTLGIITRAVLRLRPQPTSTQTALLALRSFDQVPELLRKLEGRFAGQLSSFELMWNDLYEFSSGARLQARPRPLPAGHSVYVLVETLGSDAVRDLELFQAGLEESQASGLIEDAVIAQSERDRGHFWDIRDDLSELFRPLFPLAAFDISLSLTDMPVFVERTRAGILQAFPQSQLFYYGHAGDGNLHLIVSLDPQDPEAELKVDMTVYSCVRQLGGSISAEHGIGTAKRHFIGFTRTPQELRLMRSIKQALDPKNILNPGKVLPDME